MSRAQGILAFCACALVALGLASCDDRTRKTRRVPENFELVPGRPQVDLGQPAVLTDETRETGDFRLNVPRQCDLYQQFSVRKVDILWVVDSSGSMAPKQQRLANNLDQFISQLVSAQPPIDFHIGVVSTDTDDTATRGTLRPWTLGMATGRYIACKPDSSGTGTTCNAGGGTPAEAVTAFKTMTTVGINGSAQERGLYAAYLALTNPANKATPSADNFIRDDAALYVVVVSDEDDASCHPLVQQSVCTADPGCRCAPDSILGGATAYGSTEYFTRFLETYKGFGNGELVALAAIVATQGGADAGVPSQFGDPNPHVGCCRSSSGGCTAEGVDAGTNEVAYFGGRYLQVATATGGVAVSICEDDFQGALSSLGYAASGLRREFRLTRGPQLEPAGGVAAGVQLFVSAPNAATCQVDGNCPANERCRQNRCAREVPVQLSPSSNQPQYLRCDASAFRNVIRFDGLSVPASLSTVEICYDVDPEFSTTCL